MNSVEPHRAHELFVNYFDQQLVCKNLVNLAKCPVERFGAPSDWALAVYPSGHKRRFMLLHVGSERRNSNNRTLQTTLSTNCSTNDQRSIMDPVPVSIIIPNYNGERILGGTLTSVVEAAHAYPGECEIIVVDDASQDNSMKLITENFPEINLVRHETNRGFAEAVHSGARSSTHQIIILLNSDVRPDPNFIAPLVRWFGHDDTFSVSPLICGGSGVPQRVSWNLGKIVRGEIRKRNWEIEDAQELARRGQALRSLYASGGSIALRKWMFFELGGFLPLYKPFYYEDRDLGTRAWRRGWQTFFEPKSKVIHDHYQGTIKRFFPEKKVKIIGRRNRFFYLWLHLSASRLIFSHFPWIFFRLPLRLLQLDTVYAMALFKALSSLREVVKLRGNLKKEQYTKSLEKVIIEIGY